MPYISHVKSVRMCVFVGFILLRSFQCLFARMKVRMNVYWIRRKPFEILSHFLCEKLFRKSYWNHCCSEMSDIKERFQRKLGDLTKGAAIRKNNKFFCLDSSQYAINVDSSFIFIQNGNIILPLVLLQPSFCLMNRNIYSLNERWTFALSWNYCRCFVWIRTRWQ